MGDELSGSSEIVDPQPRTVRALLVRLEWRAWLVATVFTLHGLLTISWTDHDWRGLGHLAEDRARLAAIVAYEAAHVATHETTDESPEATGQYGQTSLGLEGGLAESLGVQSILQIASQIIGMVVAGIAFCIWFHRAMQNVHDAGARDLKYAPGAAWSSFLIPFLNLVRPYQVMSELWRATTQLTAGVATSRRTGGFVPLIAGWWFFFLLHAVVRNVAAARIDGPPFSGSVDVIAVFERELRTDLFFNVLEIPGLVIAVALVFQLTGMQARLGKSTQPLSAHFS